jgi:hypothetical protein
MSSKCFLSFILLFEHAQETKHLYTLSLFSSLIPFFIYQYTHVKMCDSEKGGVELIYRYYIYGGGVGCRVDRKGAGNCC